MDDIGVKLHQTLSNSKLYNKTSNLEECEILFFPGCSLSTHKQYIIDDIYRYLKKHIKNVGISFSCCFKPSFLVRDMDSFERYYTKLDEKLKDNKINKVIVACPNCYKTIKSNSKQIEVIFLLDIIKEYGIDDDLKGYYNNIDIEFMLHDACAIRGENSIYDSSRYILDELGIKYKEFILNKEKSMCCGEKIKDKVKSEKVLKKRLEGIENDHIISYCQACSKRMLSQDKKSIHILDLLFNEQIINKKEFSQHKVNLVESWINRYKVASKITK